MINENLSPEPVLVSFDQKKYEDQIGSLEVIRDLLQQAVDIFNSLEFEPLKRNEFYAVLTSPEGLVIERMNSTITDEDLNRGNGKRISRAAFLDSLEKPKDLYKLIQVTDRIKNKAASEIKRENSPFYGNTLQVLFKSTFKLSENGNVVVDPAIETSIKKRCETFVSKPLAKQVHTLVEKIINEINESGIAANLAPTPAHRHALDNFLDSIIRFDYDGKAYIDIDTLLRFDRA